MSTIAAMSEFLTIAQVAALLQVSERTVMRWTSAEAGKDRLLALRVGNVTRVRQSVLTRWLQQREQ